MSEAAESTINQPHPDDPELDFFGNEANGDLRIDPAGAEPKPAAEGALPDAESVAELAATSTVMVDGVEVEGAVESRELTDEEKRAIADGTSDAGVDTLPGGADPEIEGSGEPFPGDEGSAEEPAKASGTAERSYVILQELTLDAETLEALATALKQGQDPRVALFEIERLEARNHKHAFGKTCENNEYAFPVRLAAVTERAMDVKSIRPKVVTTSALEIS